MLLEARRLSKTFGGLRAVDGVDFALNPGGITGLIGPNGAGKTTFFNLISLTLPSTSGHIFFRNEEVTRLTPHVIARRGLARTFQTTTVFARSSVIENVLMGYRHRTKSNVFDALWHTRRLAREEQEALDRAHEVLTLTGLPNVDCKLASDLTQEQQKRLAIAIALAPAPELLLLDEPFAGINVDQSRGLMSLIETIASRGVTICLIEHAMHIVMALCQRIVVLDYGKKIADGTPQEIRDSPAVLEAYLGSA